MPACDPQLQDLVLAELDDFQPTAVHEPDEPSHLRAFFSTADARDAAARALASSFGVHLFVAPIDIPDDDWAARSQAQLRAVTVGRIVVAPPWDAEPAKRGRQPSGPLFVIIRPSTGFGTGHHATTRLALRSLQTVALDGRTALDIGCGSAVLAIAAVRLGAGSAVGLDIDPDAIDNASENVSLNGLERGVRIEVGDFRETASPADVVLANLTGPLLERAAPRLASLVNPSGSLIVSGFMDSERPSVIPALAALLTLVGVEQEEEWLCATFRKPVAG